MDRQFDRQKLRDQSGFTLIEMLVVVVILGILAMIIVPQLTSSTSDATERALETNLSTIRSAIEIYAAQHHNNYPGMIKNDDTGAATTSVADAKTAFLAQLTTYSNATGETTTTKDPDNFPYGPYLKLGVNEMPENPFQVGANKAEVSVDIATKDLNAARAKVGDGTDDDGWQYLVQLGIFFPNDAAHLDK